MSGLELSRRLAAIRRASGPEDSAAAGPRREKPRPG
jgi:hypothetical protein